MEGRIYARLAKPELPVRYGIVTDKKKLRCQSRGAKATCPCPFLSPLPFLCSGLNAPPPRPERGDACNSWLEQRVCDPGMRQLWSCFGHPYS